MEFKSMIRVEMESSDKYYEQTYYIQVLIGGVTEYFPPLKWDSNSKRKSSNSSKSEDMSSYSTQLLVKKKYFPFLDNEK